ncbi:murein biosynthesis integral membrane protein MurJ [Buchnera aphidicola]|uniref:murein biosynthesis integral membrane protein MurJ n=1 Tax=Buchnera aphidicola TaxID=9 RepID=UPI003CE4BE10
MNLLKSLISISFMTLICRILGFIRDILIASMFGASIYTDAFFISFKIPNLLRRITESAFAQCFTPVFIEYKNHKNKKYIKNLISSISGFMICILLFIIISGMFCSQFIIKITAPGFSKQPDQLILSANLLIIMFPYILLISLSSLCTVILNSWNYFAIPALSPIFLNISLIFFSIFFNTFFYPSIIVLSWAVIIGGLIQLFYQFPFLYKINMLVMPKINFYHTGLLRILKKMGLAILGISANQISLVINTIFSSLLSAGSISWIYYADRLIEFPVSILGVSLSTILFTPLTQYFKKSIHLEYKQLLNWGFRIAFILSIPSALGLFVLAKPIIIVLFQYGKFTEFDVDMTAQVLKLYSFGLIAFVLVKVLTLSFYAREEMNIPIKISLLTLISIQLINPISIFYFKHAGLALSISISSWINVLLLFRELYIKNIIYFRLSEYVFLFHIIIATLVMLLILIFLLKIMPIWHIGSFFYKIIRLCFVIFIASFGYLFTLYILGIQWLHISYKKL